MNDTLTESEIADLYDDYIQKEIYNTNKRKREILESGNNFTGDTDAISTKNKMSDIELIEFLWKMLYNLIGGTEMSGVEIKTVVDELTDRGILNGEFPH